MLKILPSPMKTFDPSGEMAHPLSASAALTSSVPTRSPGASQAGSAEEDPPADERINGGPTRIVDTTSGTDVSGVVDGVGVDDVTGSVGRAVFGAWAAGRGSAKTSATTATARTPASTPSSSRRCDGRSAPRPLES